MILPHAHIGNFVLSTQFPTPSRALLTVAHDGARDVPFDPFLPKRRVGELLQQVGTGAIARDTALVSQSNMVLGLMPRCYVDYDQPEAAGYERGEFASTYQEFHGTVFERLRQQFVRGYLKSGLLLIDIHNFSRQPATTGRMEGYDIILSGDPVPALAPFLEVRGYAVHVSGEHERVIGGFITREVSKQLGVPALQLKVNTRFCRRTCALDGTALSTALADFIKEHYGV